MDQLPRSNEGFANNGLFADSQQYNAYDNLSQPGADPNFYDASWGINASAYPGQSRAPQTSGQAWHQNANHLSTAPAHAGFNSQATPYARSLSQSPAPFGQNHFNNFNPQQNFQYRQPQYDPTLVSPHAYGQAFNYGTTNYQTPNIGTIAPQALEHEARPPTFNRSPYAGVDHPMGNTNQARPIRPYGSETVDQRVLATAIPNGKPAGYFSIINFDDLSKATTSERMGNFLNIGKAAQNWDVTRAAVPGYVPRKSRSELRKLAGNDQKLLSKLGKKSVKKERSLASTTKQMPLATTNASPTGQNIKYEDESSSEEESSSDDDSDSTYSSDEAIGPSPNPPKRPGSPREATEYDTVKALWRGKRSGIAGESIRKGIVEFWDIIKTVRDRWKADSNAVADAETKNRENELPLLKSRVKDQRDMMESAFKAALKHGHREIIGLFSENAPLLYLCYQFLLDRIKAEEYNGPLSRVILETMTLFTTLSDEKLEKTHLVKILPRLAKKGDAKTQGYAKRIISNAASGSKTKPGESSEKKTLSKDGSAASPSGKQVEPVAGVKRAASTAGEGGSQKKLATSAAKTSSAISTGKQNGVTKKTTPAAEASKTPPTTITKSKPVTARPSGMFSTLQSAAKKPGTSITSKGPATSKPNEKSATASAPTAAPKSTFSFAETMANLSKPKEEKPAPKQEEERPQETAEEKAKRLKKESRRNLRVQFKTGDDLVQTRIFTHDPEEELGHDASQVRDVTDVGLEGRMFKQQHQMMDVDDDEDAAEETEKLIEFVPPKEIDFRDVDEEERNRNYAPFGGGRNAPDSAELAIRDYYEANNLIVFYTDPSDIPPNPREPSDPTNGEPVDRVRNFGKPEEKWALRARQKRAGPSQYYGGVQQMFNVNSSNLKPGLDLSKLPAFMNTQPPHPTAFQPLQQSSSISSDAINNILASLKQANATPPTSVPPPMGGYNSMYTPPPPTMNMQPPPPATQPSGPPDLASILAQLTQNQTNTALAPQIGGYNYNPAGAIPNMMGYGAPAQQPATYENSERKQWREGTGRKPSNNPAQNPFYKTKVCKYWQMNACQKGDNCTYKHAED